MNFRIYTRFTFVAILFVSMQNVYSQHKLQVAANQVIAPVSPTMWGIFFEDINFGADGGLYAEMIKNRSFEFPAPLAGWKEWRQGGNGRILVENSGDLQSVDARYAKVTIDAASGGFGFTNEGFRGMGFAAAKEYRFSILARHREGSLRVRVDALNGRGQKIGGAEITGLNSEWKESQVSFTTTDTALNGKLLISFEGKGIIEIKRTSLFPHHTWKGRPNGLRADLVQLLADMRPGFLRFPGGCIVEGKDLSNRYQWKETIGDPTQRKLIVNRWNMEFRHRPAPDYYQSFGLGFFEYFQLAEDIGAEPLPILNCGMACQFNSSEVVAMEGLDVYIQDALDLIEFANGPTTSKWGKIRSEMGHPEPFNLKYLGIGNEQWDVQYIDRYREFQKAIRQKYPEVKLVSAAGASPDGKMFDYAWKELKEMNADIIDEHYYQSPAWFLKNASRYDHYDRSGPKVFAGEYAAQSKAIASIENRNNWECALSEAAFMTGLERNADVVTMASYAPLFAHVDAWQWTPDLIWFDNLRAFGTPNYYVQKLFSTNKGTHLVPILEEGKPLTGQDNLYASSVIDRKTGEVIIKIINAGAGSKTAETKVTGSRAKKEATVTSLTAADKNAVNTLDHPTAISPVESKAQIKDGTLFLNLPAFSFTVVRIPISLK